MAEIYGTFILLIFGTLHLSCCSIQRNYIPTSSANKPPTCSCCSNGVPGQPGTPGMNGIAGLDGQKGHKGDKGELGPRGPIGLAGPIGDDGKKGSRGKKGLKGDCGPKGTEGKDGKNGPIGPQGHRGHKGHKGDSAPTEKKIAFSASRSTRMGPVMEDTTVTYDKIFVNIGDSFDKYTNHFQCKLNGTYLFSAHIVGQNNIDAFAWIMLNKNHMVALHGDGRAGYGTGSNTVILKLKQGDQVWLQLQQNSAILNDYASFSGYLLFENP